MMSASMTLSDFKGHFNYLKHVQIPHLGKYDACRVFWHFAITLHITGCIFTAWVDASEVSRCYSLDVERNKCFYTSDSVLSLNDAREFCKSRNSTLPIITDEVIDIVFQRFIVDVTRNRSVWIDAEARRHSDNNTATWRWIDGRTSGNFVVTSVRYYGHIVSRSCKVQK